MASSCSCSSRSPAARVLPATTAHIVLAPSSSRRRIALTLSRT